MLKKAKKTKEEVSRKNWIEIRPMVCLDGFLPYPYFVYRDATISHQRFWRGNPYRLIGFARVPEAGRVDLDFEAFWRDPKLCKNMYPVFSTRRGRFYTSLTRIQVSMKHLDSGAQKSPEPMDWGGGE